MSLSSDLAAKDALIQRLLSEKHAQAELLQKQCEILVQYLVLDIEDYLADVHRKREETEEASSGHRLHHRLKLFFFPQKQIPKYHHHHHHHHHHHLHLGRFNIASVWHGIRHRADYMWEQWAANPYGLHAICYLTIMVLLLVWMHGSIIIGFFEVGSTTGTLRLAKFCRAALGAIPPLVQFLLFLFPPLFVQF